MSTDIAPLAKLREPFPESEIRYLPRVWCKACRDSRAGCNHHQRQKCNKCRNNISTAHIDLRYVGHAEATNRLLNVDPEWSWEPVASDEKGLPQYDANGGLWIRLTVCGVTRLGYGHAEGKRGGDAVKEIIGDAIRNAGMRFGMALDLWTSSDLEIAEDGPKSDRSDVPERHLRRVQPGETDPWATPGPAPELAATDPAFAGPERGSAQWFADLAAKADSPERVKELWALASAGRVLDGPVTAPSGTRMSLREHLTRFGMALKGASPATSAGQVPSAEVADDGYRTAPTVDDPPAATTSPEAEAEAAERELRTWAEHAGLPDIARDFEGAKGMPLSAATADQIRAFHAELTGTAA